jgi:YVTN family beta-propeller protein
MTTTIALTTEQGSHLVFAKKKNKSETMTATTPSSNSGGSGVDNKFNSSKDGSSIRSNGRGTPLSLVSPSLRCPEGSSPELINGRCPKPTPTPPKCPDGSEIVKGECICPNGSPPTDSKCQSQPNPKPIKCPKGSSPVDGKCVCPDGLPVPVHGKCTSPIPTPTPPKCPDGSEIVKGECICPNGSSPVNSKCPNPTPLPGSLTFLDVIKKVVNNNGGTKNPSDFTITVSGNHPSPSSFAGSSSGTSVTLRSGSYRVTEDNNIPGYTTSYSSGCSGIARGGHIQCTITNDYQLTPTMSKLRVTKKVVNNGIGDKNPSDFTITVSGNHPSPSSFPGNGREGTIVSLKPGSYKVSESGPSGYTSSFSSDCSSRIEYNQEKACIITNEAKKLPPPSPPPKPLIVTTIKGLSGPFGIAYDSANNDVYVTNHGKNVIEAGKVSVIDSSTNTVVDTVLVGKKPQAITYNPGNNGIYVANTLSNTVSVLNTLRNNNNVIATILVGNFPGNGSSGIASDPANGKIYVANIGSGILSVIDSSTNSVVDNIKGFFGPSGIAYDSGNGHIYVTNKQGNTVSVLNTLRNNNNVIATIHVGTSPSAIAYDAANGHIYVANSGSSHSRGTISVIDDLTNKVISTIGVGTGPNGVAYNPANGKIYVANTLSNTISVIDGFTNNVIATIPVGINPYGVLYNPANHYIYAANYGSNTISVIR